MSKRDICPDCHVEVGELHQTGCDWETCPNCGGQMLSCRCLLSEVELAGRIPYNGRDGRPDQLAAEEHGFWCYCNPDWYGDPERHYGWIPCEKNHPNAALDLNRIASECEWDRAAKKYVLPDSKKAGAIGAKEGGK